MTCHDTMEPGNMTGGGCLQFSVCGRGMRGTGGTPPCWRRWRRTRGWRWRLPSSRRSWTRSWLLGDPDTHTSHSAIQSLLTAYIKFSHIKTKKPKAPIKVIFSVPYKGETSSIILFFLPVDWKVEQSFPSFQVRHLYSSDGYQHGHADQPPVVLPSLKIFGIKENIYSHST